MKAGDIPVKVWDAPVRLFHWLIVLLFAFMYATGKVKGDWLDWHMRGGYAILALVLFRLLWGFFGSTHARFSSFLSGPAAALQFAKKLASRAPAPVAGHNPLGGWMVIALLIVLGVQAGTGLFANDDILVEGPLASLVSKDMSNRLTSWHYWNFNLLQVLVAVHVLAVIYHLRVMKEDLVGAMFTGVKHLPADTAAATKGRIGNPWLALALLLVAALAVYLIVKRPF